MDPSTLTKVSARPAAAAQADAGSDTAPLATIALVVHNRAQLTLRALVALAGAKEATPFHTVLIDDGSTDATPALAAGVGGAFTARREERRRGFAAGCDSAFALSREPVVVFMRQDLVVTDGWLERLLAPFADPKVGAVRPRVLDLAGHDLAGASWPALAVRHAAYAELGSMSAGAQPGRPLKETFAQTLLASGWQLLSEPGAVLLWVPDAASQASNIFEL